VWCQGRLGATVGVPEEHGAIYAQKANAKPTEVKPNAIRHRFRDSEIMSPDRPLPPSLKHRSSTEKPIFKIGSPSGSSLVGFGLVKKVSRRRSIGVSPLVDVERSEFEADPKLDDSIKLQADTSFASLQTTKKRRRMSI